MRLTGIVFALVAAAFLVACDSGTQDETGTPVPDLSGTGSAADASGASNILLLIGDDMGVEAMASFGVGTAPAETPYLDALARQGIRFTSVWSQPTCSPTRATIMTGEYGFRNGVGAPTGGPGLDGPLPEDPAIPEGVPTEYIEELTFARTNTMPWSFARQIQTGEVSRQQARRSGLPPEAASIVASLKRMNPNYRAAAIGKWHLGETRNGWLEHPGNLGFDHYSVLPGNATPSFFAWVENVNGTAVPRTGYTPERKVEEALSWIDQQEDAPWFLWFAFNLPHLPFFVPEASGVTLDAPADAVTASELPDSNRYFDLMVTEMDRMIGELLQGLAPEVRENTVVIFVGDNGSAPESIDPPFDATRPKFTLYQGGISVPLIISGPGIAEGGEVSALVNTTDLFATILELASGEPLDASENPSGDSVSLVPYLSDISHAPIRRFSYADKFVSNLGINYGDFAIRDARYKLISSTARQEFFDLQADPYETEDLIAAGARLDADAQSAYDSLLSQARALHGSTNAVTPVPALE